MKKFTLFLKVSSGLLFLLFAGLSLSNSAQAAGDVFPQVFVNQVVASGLDHPVLVTHAGDGSKRLFVIEQPGQIKIVQNGVVLGTPFLDIRSKVSYGGERGLLGLAFHPNYKTNGFFYVNYTRSSDGATVIERYTVSSNDPNLASPGSAFTILIIPQPYANHNGGNLVFGNDGKLYIGMGDGGGTGDPQNNAQNIDSLLGKLLRIDVDSASPYGIPADNPYVGKAGADEIWALGLRNPWRFSFDRQTGDMLIGDVGQNLWEEVDYQPAGVGGVNYGWSCYEGTHTYDTTRTCPGATFPIAEYSHTEGQSITGGYVYRGKLFPTMLGFYFYADFSTGKIWALQKTGVGTWSAPALLLDTPYSISSFGEDEDGEVYIADYYGGTIRLLGTLDLSTLVHKTYLPFINR